jgi:hypothetical protein
MARQAWPAWLAVRPAPRTQRHVVVWRRRMWATHLHRLRVPLPHRDLAHRVQVEDQQLARARRRAHQHRRGGLGACHRLAAAEGRAALHAEGLGGAGAVVRSQQRHAIVLRGRHTHAARAHFESAWSWQQAGACSRMRRRGSSGRARASARLQRARPACAPAPSITPHRTTGVLCQQWRRRRRRRGQRDGQEGGLLGPAYNRSRRHVVDQDLRTRRGEEPVGRWIDRQCTDRCRRLREGVGE